MFLQKKGSSAWSAKDNDFAQYLIIDLGQIMNITRIWTKGRPFSSEYVMEYQISYGTNGLDYAFYKDSQGDIRVGIKRLKKATLMPKEKIQTVICRSRLTVVHAG